MMDENGKRKLVDDELEMVSGGEALLNFLWVKQTGIHTVIAVRTDLMNGMLNTDRKLPIAQNATANGMG